MLACSGPNMDNGYSEERNCHKDPNPIGHIWDELDRNIPIPWRIVSKFQTAIYKF